jgi:hypothetical protein
MEFNKKEIELMKHMDEIFRRLDMGECVNPFFTPESLKLYEIWRKEAKAHTLHLYPKSA